MPYTPDFDEDQQRVFDRLNFNPDGLQQFIEAGGGDKTLLLLLSPELKLVSQYFAERARHKSEQSNDDEMAARSLITDMRRVLGACTMYALWQKLEPSKPIPETKVATPTGTLAGPRTYKDSKPLTHEMPAKLKLPTPPAKPMFEGVSDIQRPQLIITFESLPVLEKRYNMNDRLNSDQMRAFTYLALDPDLLFQLCSGRKPADTLAVVNLDRLLLLSKKFSQLARRAREESEDKHFQNAVTTLRQHLAVLRDTKCHALLSWAKNRRGKR